MHKIASLLFICLSLSALAEDTLDRCYQLINHDEYQEAYVLALTLLNSTDTEVVSDAYYVMGYCRRKQNHFSEALRYYEKAIEKSNDPDKKGKIGNNIVVLLQFTSLHERAVEEAEKAFAMSDTWRLVSLFNKAYSLRMLDRFEEALATIETGVDICRETQNEVYILKLWNLQAEILYEQENAASASTLLEEIIRVGSIPPQGENKYVKTRNFEIGKAHLLLGKIFLFLGDTISAKQSFSNGLNVQHDNQERFYILSELIMISDDKTEWMNRVMEIYPDLTLSEKTLKFLISASEMGLIQLSDFEKEFDKYVRQEKATQEVYTAYIGRQILKEEALLNKQKTQNRWSLIAGALTLLAALGLIFILRKRK